MFEDSRKLLFIINSQQDFMIIFLTSSFTTLGALKVNNLCLLKLPFKELRGLCRHYLIQQHHRTRNTGTRERMNSRVESLFQFSRTDDINSSDREWK